MWVLTPEVREFLKDGLCTKNTKPWLLILHSVESVLAWMLPVFLHCVHWGPRSYFFFRVQEVCGKGGTCMILVTCSIWKMYKSALRPEYSKDCYLNNHCLWESALEKGWRWVWMPSEVFSGC